MMAIRLPAPRRSLALAAAAAAFAAGAADADLDTGREILHTGQTIPGLGRVGTLSASPLAIDDHGRVVVAIALADGSRAIARIEGGRVVPLWRHAQGGDALTPDIGSAIVSPDGTHIAALGGPQLTGSTVFSSRVLYDLSSGAAQPLLSAGDRTADGTTIIGFTAATAISDAGAVLVAARLEAPDVDPQSGAEAVLLHDGSGTTVLASTILDPDVPRQVVYVQAHGFATDGAAVLTICEANGVCTVSRSQDGALAPVIAPGDAAPDGSTVSTVSGLAVASNGEVLATVDYGRLVVRTEQGRLVRVRAATDPIPDAGFFIAGGHLNAAGFVTLQLLGVDGHDNATWRRVALYAPATGAVELLPEGTSGGQINDAAQIAVRVAAAGAPVRVARWQNDGLETLLTAHDTARDGTAAWSAGIRGACLDEEGRVATLVDGIDGSQGWACVDATGPHLQSDRARPAERYVPQPVQCAFGAAGEIVALANGRLERVGDETQTILVIGDRLPDGRPVDDITAVAANPDGTLVAVVSTGEDRIALRQVRGGVLEVVDVDGDGGGLAPTAGIADDGTVVAAAWRENGQALLAIDERGSRVLLGTAAAGEPLTLENLHVRGMAAVASFFGANGARRHFLFDLTADTRREILHPDTLPDARAQVQVLDLAATGDVLYTTTVPDDLFASPTETWIWRGGSSEPVRQRESEFSTAPQPFRLNAVGNVLQYAPTIGGGRTQLTLSGPSIAAACPGQSTATADSDGCQVSTTASASRGPLLSLLLAAAIALMRRARGPLPQPSTGTS